MSAEGADFAWGKPPPATCVAVGLKAVGGYVSSDATGKNLTAENVAGYRKVGLGVWLVFEDAADPTPGGAAAGVRDAHIALAGRPDSAYGTTRPIYFALDSDVSAAAAVAYFRGIVQVLPASLVGCYAAAGALRALKAAGLCSWFWQSSSAAFLGNGHQEPGGLWVLDPWPDAHIVQQTTGPIPGFDTDGDVLQAEDFGQLPQPTPAPPFPITEILEANMECYDPVSGGIWVVGPDGHVECPTTPDGVGAPYLGGLGGNRFNWQGVGALAGCSARHVENVDGSYEVGLDVAVLLHDGNRLPDGEWFTHYQFPRDGSRREQAVAPATS